jgi:uncharacterized protein with GYD domain
MMTFIIVGNFTPAGLGRVKNVTECILEMKTQLNGVGGQITRLDYTLGHYDFVAYVETPDEKSMLKAMMEVAHLGFAKTETLLAIPAKEAAEMTKTGSHP